MRWDKSVLELLGLSDSICTYCSLYSIFLIVDSKFLFDCRLVKQNHLNLGFSCNCVVIFYSIFFCFFRDSEILFCYIRRYYKITNERETFSTVMYRISLTCRWVT